MLPGLGTVIHWICGGAAGKLVPKALHHEQLPRGTMQECLADTERLLPPMCRNIMLALLNTWQVAG
jgi:hypothetical protein